MRFRAGGTGQRENLLLPRSNTLQQGNSRGSHPEILSGKHFDGDSSHGFANYCLPCLVQLSYFFPLLVTISLARSSPKGDLIPAN